MRKMLRAAVLTAASFLSAGPASAQIYIGQIAGEMVAEQQAAAQEAACRKGTPADPDAVKKDNVDIEKTMDAYFKLNAKSSASDVTKLFADKPDASWQDSGGKVPLNQLPAHLGDPPAGRTLLVSVVGGDNVTTRAIWSASEGNSAIFYAVDFVNADGWFSRMRIWHMTVAQGPTPPDTPPAYCHFDPEQSF